MVQQMVDSKVNQYGLPNTGAGLPTSDKQHAILVKKTALRDLQNDNRISLPKPQGNSTFLKEKGPLKDAKVSGNKRASPECPAPASPPGHQSLSSNGENSHLVYVRRKSESELGKSNMDNDAGHPPARQFNHGDQETPRQLTQMKEPKMSCFSAYTPIPMASLMTFSSGGPTVPLSLGKAGNGLPLAEPKNPAVTSAPVPLVNHQGNSEPHWKERFIRLQTFLRNCDHSSQEDYIQMLRSLTPSGRSRHAVELEKRAIHLSLEEGKEIHRMTILNVLGKSTPKNSASPLSQQVQPAK
ncbi:PREDICTED: uncharacterized protein LOC104603754 [Nelumbo nucifera]|uniref:Uncharacterized protein LOC104603754 n=2 Tax=Nelumbo nucifera TaxID=4432 RepID=A0A1U8ASV2_NELNU|nr:PREDICTED: uncharacterized protein LOC104603754 [Nelumbo nucifera]XP_010266174.1 PREDICTED: uncharacterized protein LOC104603754 [Nelumbo nucifera]DAD41810.1 TPA_asm: hypothetical protein HUJ06_016133 [Nelumbo nucifera]